MFYILVCLYCLADFHTDLANLCIDLKYLQEFFQSECNEAFIN